MDKEITTKVFDEKKSKNIVEAAKDNAKTEKKPKTVTARFNGKVDGKVIPFGSKLELTDDVRAAIKAKTLRVK